MNTGGYELRLAEKVEPNEDSTEYIVTLKQGVKFHNGETMTADDVVFSYGLAQASARMALISARWIMSKKWMTTPSKSL